MDKNMIKSFATESRRKLIESVKYQASLIGISAESISEPISKAEGMETYDYGAGTYTIFDKDLEKRHNLVNEIENKGFENVVEKIAYTWFNRIIAIRYMEVNDYLPTRTRVLSSEVEGKIEPDILTEALELDLDYTLDDKDLIFKLKDENKLDELFQFLFIKQCNKLNDELPGLFEKTDDYMELLLNISFTDEESIIRQLIKYIPENDFREDVEIIGWLYQYYISEKKDKLNNALKSKPIKKNDIPASTQLFTPDWIVKYMVDNSLGRYWIERNNGSALKEKLKYYIDEPNNEIVINEDLNNINYNPIDLKFFDPCMGSAHILVYAFDIFMEIYIERGYIEKEIPELILKNNLYGLDIDNRAYQFAYFALMMKGRYHDRNFFKKNITPNIYPIVDSNISKNTLDYINSYDEKLADIVSYLIDIFKDASEFGSLIKIKKFDFEYYHEKLQKLLNTRMQSISDYNIGLEIANNLVSIFNQAKLLSLKYDVVVTNPPYLNRLNNSLKKFSKKYYNDYSRDLFAMFIYRNFDFCNVNGYTAFMTPLVWMYIKSFENLRKFLINNKTIVSLIEMEYNTLWEIEAHVPACTFVLSNKDYNPDYKSIFLKLSEFTGGLEVQKEKTLQAITTSVDYKYIRKSSDFLKIPGSPIAYWVDDRLIDCFSNTKLDSVGSVKQGLATSDNNRFLRFWYEVDINKLGLSSKSTDDSLRSNKKWFPYNKGGNYCKWYGNQDFVVNWENDGYEIRNFKDDKGKLKSRPQNTDFYFKKSISWSLLSSSYFGVRFYPEGFIFDVNGSSLFLSDKYYYYIGGFLTSKLSTIFLSILNSTMAFQVGNIKNLPIIIDDEKIDDVNNLVKNNIFLSKLNWDCYETSWNFSSHPLLKFSSNLIKDSYSKWVEFTNNQFNEVKYNEIALNKIFSEIYEVDIDCHVDDNNITMNSSDYEMDIKSFISYAVGCMFGRYSLDNEGIQFAGGQFNIRNYNKFVPDDDNIIPILDTEYFEDDIVGKFVEFVKICFGEENLEENLNFIADALNKKGASSREIIRNYFLMDFYKNHIQIYKKHPIYWQFDSGKQNAFKCIIYMHRYEPDIIARVRTDYLHKTQKAIEQNLAHCENIISNSSNKSEISKATKDKTKYIKQLDEIKVYDEALGHLANQQIPIDLDDGVQVNYAKFQNIEISKEGEKTKKVNLLKKI